MDIKSFFVEVVYRGKPELIEVKPCCQQDNVYYYDISIKNKYQFTVTPSPDKDLGIIWKISLKNADKHVDNALIDLIGEEIEKHILQV